MRAERRAPGYRGAGNEEWMGGLAYVGAYGYSWASTVNEKNSMYMAAYVTWLEPCSSSFRAFGFQLRCLSE